MKKIYLLLTLSISMLNASNSSSSSSSYSGPSTSSSTSTSSINSSNNSSDSDKEWALNLFKEDFNLSDKDIEKMRSYTNSDKIIKPSLLLAAIGKENIDLVKKYLNSGKFDVNERSKEMGPLLPLFVAACQPSDKIEIVDLLLKKGANINLPNLFFFEDERIVPDELTALDAAARANNINVVKFLIEKGAHLGKHAMRSTLYDIVGKNKIEIVKLLFDNPESFGEYSKYSFLEYHFENVIEKSSSYPDCSMVELFIENGAKVNDKIAIIERTYLMLSIKSNNLNTTAFLINKGANINRLVKVQLQDDNKFNDSEITPLMYVSDEGVINKAAFIRLFISMGADVDIKSKPFYQFDREQTVFDFFDCMKDTSHLNLLKEWQDYLREYNKNKKKYGTEFEAYKKNIEENLSSNMSSDLIKLTMGYVANNPFAYFIETYHPKMEEKYNELVSCVKESITKEISENTKNNGSSSSSFSSSSSSNGSTSSNCVVS